MYALQCFVQSSAELLAIAGNAWQQLRQIELQAGSNALQSSAKLCAELDTLLVGSCGLIYALQCFVQSSAELLAVAGNAWKQLRQIELQEGSNALQGSAKLCTELDTLLVGS